MISESGISFIGKETPWHKVKEVKCLQDSLKRYVFRTASHFSLHFYLLVCFSLFFGAFYHHNNCFGCMNSCTKDAVWELFQFRTDGLPVQQFNLRVSLILPHFFKIVHIISENKQRKLGLLTSC